MNKIGIKKSSRLDKEITSLETKIDRLEEKYVFEEISKRQYDKFKSKLSADIN